MLFTTLRATLPQDGGDWRNWVPVASAFVALVALVVAISNRNTARKAVALAKAQEDRRSAHLDVSLSDGIWWRPAEPGSRWICVKVLAVNPTDRDGSIVRADLHVTYTLPTGGRTVVKIEPSGTHVTFPEGIKPQEVPVRLQANGAISGWFMYEIDDDLIHGPIDRYDIVFSDSRGPVETVQAWVMREVNDNAAP